MTIKALHIMNGYHGSFRIIVGKVHLCPDDEERIVQSIESDIHHYYINYTDGCMSSLKTSDHIIELNH